MADTTTIVGNLTEDPALRFTQGGAAVSNFSVAVTPRVKDGDGWKD
jgi:single-strand DNA-binding protein